MSRRQAAETAPALITKAEELAALCERLRAEEFVTVDTEFMRERTYWPELCVVQLGGEEETAVVDALAEGMDLAPLGALLADRKVTKVFHAARQDIEIFLLKFGAVPNPLFDTQVAAMVAGFGDQVSYDALARSLAGAQIDKAHRFSDWSARPLSAQQIAYAAADVTHLRRIYTGLRTRLEREGRLDWVAEEMAVLNDPATYRTEPEKAWERLKPRTSNRRFLGMLRALAAWREREAQRINIPRQRLVKDETLLELAATSPETPADLARARGISEGFAKGRSGAGLLAAVKDAKGEAEADLPHPPKDRGGPSPSPALVALLKVLLAAKSEEHNVAPRLLASSEDLDRLATEAEPDLPALHGWRREVFGDAALALKSGRLALGVDGRRVKLIEAA
ncbi:ribonuclease D [Paracraurococcus ruber]|uniref:Ribonuclease D n=1 Tax=Paracraurococcus ruber TaxID=77675 RepID=A0ABS1D2I1_9PROT|nr:ribonuclease D [Paracraurococcus ruber]MBK1661050.1 ribonuclease D [Paracraurococcus ruber]TDG28374.1 ribonuclease D [Paracraurococcus ruber]